MHSGLGLQVPDQFEMEIALNTVAKLHVTIRVSVHIAA